MALKPVKRKYGFSDGTLDELGDSLISSAERDLVQMTAFGYTQVRLDEIKELVQEFKDFASDEYYSGLMTVATSEKRAAISTMTEGGEGIVARATIKYGKASPVLNMFGWAGYITKTDSDKTRANRLVLKVGTEKLAELGAQGLTQALLDEYDANIRAADTAITEKDKKVKERDSAVNTRTTLGNALYDELVLLAGTGKHIWEDTNEAFYNDYVIYDSQPGAQTVTGEVAPNSIHQPSVVIDSGDDEVEITVEGDEELIAFCSDDPTDEPAPGQITVTVNAASPFAGTAAQLGWNNVNNRLLFKNMSAGNATVFTVVVR